MSPFAVTPPAEMIQAQNKAETVPDYVGIVPISDKERDGGFTNRETLQKCLEYFHRDGMVVITNAIPEHLVDKMNDMMIAESKALEERGDVHFHQGKSTRNMSVCPPMTEEWMMPEFWVNQHVMDVTEQIIGPKPDLSFARSNVCLPHATGRQAVHADGPSDVLRFTYMVENGATELWLGTHSLNAPEHHVSEDLGWIKKSSLIERARVRPPIQCSQPKGSICIRDVRMWHSGMPNLTDTYRIMTSYIYTPPWWNTHMFLTLPKDVKDHVEKWNRVTVKAEYVDEFDNKSSPFVVNMSQKREHTMVNNGVNGMKYLHNDKKFSPGEPREITKDYYWTPEDAA
ncbi:hypothetical protein LTR47_011584 [Exophiala xenobiotica]|nr:hypothetical protein LTR41_010633 [Exophiala xenobiotica]KAK5219267.1 hypothetical protein LTR47_011584 [Exophiala xenobiotica]KAK5251315.1 hypothetical protein LTS06_004072 [Exophiala xenobiotica]KAK5350801.1 hypothetical protein LTR61_005999 [Exophiala xenobiotica]KAK5377783.1 hypothetical protein LTS03_004658 [Exophiala xenobiotica]